MHQIKRPTEYGPAPFVQFVSKVTKKFADLRIELTPAEWRDRIT